MGFGNVPRLLGVWQEAPFAHAALGSSSGAQGSYSPEAKAPGQEITTTR
jgi:hypothetical protein